MMADTSVWTYWQGQPGRYEGPDHCTYINLWCPDDFCTLRYRHKGRHLLGTMPYDLPEAERTERHPGDGAPRYTSLIEIVRLAVEEQQRRGWE